ncbi:MAG: 4-(cytidine 5'-diphospho)-2-C-methyl-D-erythritol kinase [Alphaproteobacteria bacterium]|nr:4-(cytidine 5'-diphospho)-2-C-methyl-D-erythritol kinase [Alphaproteobacteria bacterium]
MRARAKLNLYLHVLGRRADGYHVLDSLVVFADMGDEMRVRPADALSVAIDGPFAAALQGAPPEDNLVWRAAVRLAEAAGVPVRARIELTKNLPVASGIGGGSADAAAALRLLSALWGARADDGALQRLAFSLGADVPMCLAGVPAFAGGAGERLDPAPALPPVHAVLVNCGVAVATKDVFARRAGAYSEPARFAEAPADADAFARILAARRNDLEAPARAIAPAIGQTIAALERAHGCLLARMSGSGATCFGLFADEAAARVAAARIGADNPEWWVVAAALTRAPAPMVSV